MQTIRAEVPDKYSGNGSNYEASIKKSVWHRQNPSTQGSLEKMDEGFPVPTKNRSNPVSFFIGYYA